MCESPTSSDIVEDIRFILAGVKDSIFPRTTRRRIETTLKKVSPWAKAKRQGKQVLENSPAAGAYDRLSAGLRRLGIFIVEVGELEGFDPTVNGVKGPKWVNRVLTKDLAAAEELCAARDFVWALVATAS